MLSADLHLVDYLAEKDPFPGASVTQQGRTPLDLACVAGTLSVAKKLVDLDPTLLQKTENEEWSILHLGVLSGNLQLVEWLAENDPLLLASVTQRGRSSLRKACRL